MRIKRVGLEHHRNAALCGWHIVHNRAVNLQFAAGDLFEARNHPQQGRFATARGPDENDQLACLDIKVDMLEHIDRPAVGFGNVR